MIIFVDDSLYAALSCWINGRSVSLSEICSATLVL